MKALPLWQPYASLIAIGEKRIETRHWEAPGYVLGQRVAIHACKERRDLRLVDVEPFCSALARGREAGTLALVDDALPLGALLCTVVIDRCEPIGLPTVADLLERGREDEYYFGNYDVSNGPRYAWHLRDVELLPAPVPLTGLQGIFNVPDDALLGAAA